MCVAGGDPPRVRDSAEGWGAGTARAQGLSDARRGAGLRQPLRWASDDRSGEAHSCAEGHIFSVRVALTNKCPRMQTIMFL